MQLGYALTLSKQALVYTCLQYTSFENSEGKREIARNVQFLVFTVFFYLFGELSNQRPTALESIRLSNELWRFEKKKIVDLVINRSECNSNVICYVRTIILAGQCFLIFM